MFKEKNPHMHQEDNNKTFYSEHTKLETHLHLLILSIIVLYVMWLHIYLCHPERHAYPIPNKPYGFCGR